MCYVHPIEINRSSGEYDSRWPHSLSLVHIVGVTAWLNASGLINGNAFS